MNKKDYFYRDVKSKAQQKILNSIKDSSPT